MRNFFRISLIVCGIFNVLIAVCVVFFDFWLGTMFGSFSYLCFYWAKKINDKILEKKAEQEKKQKEEESKKFWANLEERKQKEKEQKDKEEIEELIESAKSFHIVEEKIGHNITYHLCGGFTAMHDLCGIRYEIDDDTNIVSVILRCDPKFPFSTKNAFEVATLKIQVPKAEYFRSNNSFDKDWHDKVIAYFDGEKMIVDELEEAKKKQREADRIERIHKLRDKYRYLKEDERSEKLSKWRSELNAEIEADRKKREEEAALAKIENEINGGTKRKSAKDITECGESVYVYLMQNNLYTDRGVYKIGISNKPSHREKTLQSQEPDIELLKTKPYSNREKARNVERTLHEKFSEKHLRGEWFELTDEDVEYICEFLSDNPDVKRLIAFDASFEK